MRKKNLAENDVVRGGWTDVTVKNLKNNASSENALGKVVVFGVSLWKGITTLSGRALVFGNRHSVLLWLGFCIWWHEDEDDDWFFSTTLRKWRVGTWNGKWNRYLILLCCHWSYSDSYWYELGSNMNVMRVLAVCFFFTKLAEIILIKH